MSNFQFVVCILFFDCLLASISLTLLKIFANVYTIDIVSKSFLDSF